jgi:hypothetical protein
MFICRIPGPEGKPGQVIIFSYALLCQFTHNIKLLLTKQNSIYRQFYTKNA